MKKEIVKKILAETEAGYDLVAGKFSGTRKNFWIDLEFIQEYVQAGDTVLDFGCGNGRLLEIFKEKKIKYFGVDVSQKLIDLARVKYPEHAVDFQKISGYGSLALEDNFFNAVYSIAVFHHIPGEKRRKELARELFRVTQPGGYVVVTVWNLWREKYQKNIRQNRWRKFFGLSRLGWNDCLISFKNNEGPASTRGNDSSSTRGGEIFQRYHHAWTKKELEKVFSKAGFLVEKCEVVGGNILLIGRREK